jgi:glycosyltransferase involved in cell wall biosynthesis
MVSIVIPAHNEGSVIARTLSTLISGSSCEELSVTVVCNGCTDNTIDVVRRFSPAVRVVETDVASKTHALNLGDQACRGFPRIYADADVVITRDAIRALADRLNRGDVLAVAPTSDINLAGCSWLVRKYFEVRARLPSSREGIGGSGVYALSEAGRRRFAQFPNIVADDTYIRLQFAPKERETLTTARSLVFAPRTTRKLVAIRTRAHIGTCELSECFPELWKNKGAANHRSLIKLLKEPRSWVGLLIYFGVNIIARLQATVASRSGKTVWRRDNTSRVALSEDTP